MQPDEHVTPSIRLVRQLGHGGMGSVWIAWHEHLRTEVVVKFVTKAYAEHPEVLARFEREAALAAQVKSPYVVQIFDYGTAENGLPYIAMEYLEGEDLATRIRRDGPVEVHLFGEWLRQACSGLSRVHGKHIVHRDIKPENLFLCDDQGDVLVKLLDFGIAKSDAILDARTQTGALLGTPHFMSPEQAMSAKDVDLRTDLWALGVVAYYALTGVLPFQGESIGPVVLAITGTDPPPPSSLVPEIPRAIDAWMSKALAKNASERFQSAEEMANAFLAATLGQAPVDYSRGDFRAPRRRAPLPSGAPQATTLSPATVQEMRHRAASTPPTKNGGLFKAIVFGTVKAFFGALALVIVVGAVTLVMREEQRSKILEMRVRAAGPPGALAPSASAEVETRPLVEPGEPLPPRTQKARLRSGRGHSPASPSAKTAGPTPPERTEARPSATSEEAPKAPTPEETHDFPTPEDAVDVPAQGETLGVPGELLDAPFVE